MKVEKGQLKKEENLLLQFVSYSYDFPGKLRCHGNSEQGNIIDVIGWKQCFPTGSPFIYEIDNEQLAYC